MPSPRSNRDPDDFAAPGSRPATWVLICALAVLWTTSLPGQATRGSATKQQGSLFHSPLPSVPDDRVKGPDAPVSAPAASDESCFVWPLTGLRSPTTEVTSLEVPRPARKDFRRACHAASDKKWASAEEHLRKALQEDPQYTAAWVLLGQLLKAQHKQEDARGACSQALKVDPNYLPADLCLADLFAIEQRWEEMLRIANSAVALDPASNPQAYFYAAGAYLGLQRLPEAEKSALRAAEIDKTNREPRTHFLLAQIYEVERRPDAEAAQLQEYLKSVNDPEQVAMVKKYLADIARNRRK